MSNNYIQNKEAGDICDYNIQRPSKEDFTILDFHKLPTRKQLQTKVLSKKSQFRYKKPNAIDDFYSDIKTQCLVVTRERSTPKDVKNDNVNELSKQKILKRKLENVERQRGKNQKRIRNKLISIFGSPLDDISSTNKSSKNKTNETNHVQVKNETIHKLIIHQAKREEIDFNFVQTKDYIVTNVKSINANVQEVLSGRDSSLTHTVFSPIVVPPTATKFVKNMPLFYVNVHRQCEGLEKSVLATVSIVQQSEQANPAPTQTLSMPVLSPVSLAIPPQIEPLLLEESQTSNLTLCKNTLYKEKLKTHISSSPFQKTKSCQRQIYSKPPIATNLPVQTFLATKPHGLDSQHSSSRKRKLESPLYTSLKTSNNSPYILPSSFSKTVHSFLQQGAGIHTSSIDIPTTLSSHSFLDANTGNTKLFLQDSSHLGSGWPAVSLEGVIGVTKPYPQNYTTSQKNFRGGITKLPGNLALPKHLRTNQQIGIAKSPINFVCPRVGSLSHGLPSQVNKFSTESTSSQNLKRAKEAFCEKNLKSSSGLSSKPIIPSLDVLLLSIYSNIRDYCKWISLSSAFVSANQQTISFKNFRFDCNLFNSYVVKCGKMYGIRLLTDLSKYHVEKFDPQLLISGLVSKLHEDGFRVSKERLLSNIEQIILGCEELCQNSLSKKFYDFVINWAIRTREAVRLSRQSLFSSLDLDRLRQQILQHNAIQKWLNCQNTHSPTCLSSPAPHGRTIVNINIDGLSTPKKRTSCDSINITSNIITPTNGEENKIREDEEEYAETISVASTFLDCDLLIDDDIQSEQYESVIQAEGITRLTFDSDRNTNIETNDVEKNEIELNLPKTETTTEHNEDKRTTDQSVPYINTIAVKGITRLTSQTAKNTNIEIVTVQNNDTENKTTIAENIELNPPKTKETQTTIEKSEDKRTTDNCETLETKVEDSLQEKEEDLLSALKHEVVDLKYLILNENIIDLSWMNDNEYNDISGDCYNSEIDSLKNEKEIEAITKDVVCSDTSLEEYQVKVSDFYRCVCGKQALYVCACEKSMYCSFKCQSNDWNHHKKFCEDSNMKS